MATIKDIAREAGVSIATVSHVINKTRYVSPELVEQVEAAIRKVGYEKKETVQASPLKLGKQSEIALVIPALFGSLFAKLTNDLTPYMIWAIKPTMRMTKRMA